MRAGGAAEGAAVGSDRQGVSIRDRRGERLTGRLLRRALAAPRLPLHLRAPPHGGLSVLLGKSRALRRPLSEPRRHAFGGVAGRRSPSCRRTSGGWGGHFPGRPRSAASSTSTSTFRSPRSNSARESLNTTTSAAAETTGPPASFDWHAVLLDEDGGWRDIHANVDCPW